MKQFQFEYKNINNYRRELARVKRFCEITPHSSIFFQFFTEITEFDEIREMTKIIENDFPNAYYYGCQSYGNIVDGKLAKDKTVVVCSVFEYETTKTELVYIDPTDPNAKFHSLDDLWEYCNKLDWLKGIELTCTYQASGNLKIGEEPISLREDIQVFGAIACNPTDLVSDESYLFTKKEGFSVNAAVAILLGGEDVNITAFYYNGWEALGKRFTITKCDGKIIREIDGEPAMNIYKKYLGINCDEKFLTETMQFPLMLTEHGVECIRLPMPTENPNEIKLTVKVKKGTKLRLSYGEPSTILHTIKNSAKEIFEYAPETIRIYSCGSRRRFWGDNKVGLETGMLDGIAATVGFYTRGEILRVGDYLRYFNATIVTCLVREGDAIEPDYKLEDIIDHRAKQSEFSGKLLHYLEAVTTEIEGRYNQTISGIAKAYRNMLVINLKENTLTQFDQDPSMTQYLSHGHGAIEQINNMIERTVIPSQVGEAKKYCDLTTLDERMKNRSYINSEFIGAKEGWFRAQFIALSYDEKGKLEEAIFTTQITNQAKKREEELLHLAGTDELTGLYNRRSYELDMIKLKKSALEDHLIYVSIDVNSLKCVNDTLGHTAGDELIKATARCMRQAFEQYGKLYRIGGDEFVALIFASPRQLESIKKEFKRLVNEWDGEFVEELSVSTGYVSKIEYPTMSMIEIEKLADDLMYQEKVAYYERRRKKYFNEQYHALERSNTLRQIEDAQYEDTLTDGYNRLGLIRAIENLRESGVDLTEYAILFVNVKGFKAINDLFGFEAGDNLLKMLYNMYETSSLKPKVSARKEADHYIFLVEKKNLDLAGLTKILEFRWKHLNQEIVVHCRCGIYYIDDNKKEVYEMIDRAGLARSYIKDGYVKPYAIYESSMRKDYVEQAEILSRYEDAIRSHEFQVYYQPIIDAKTGKIVSAEALIRWISPEKGMISPAAFIPILEEYGYITKLDNFVIHTVNQDLHERYEKGFPMVPVSINLSRMDFFDMSLLEEIIDRTQRNAATSGSIRYEITETSYASIVECGDDSIKRMKENNRKILLDDFGSGYSSLEMIQNYDFDLLKIDMSLVRKIENNPKSRSIIEAIITMCHNLDIKVVAEGVETETQLKFLQSKDCDYIQGFYFSKPLSKKEFYKYIEENL